ncbi:hypothetical protein [Mycolicibacterium sp. PDY-3]|uniref:hypothetical protein n=1 Tax=Mycolicibacterium sp. PDY-3 TaxID=3376069 RepID=UPI0037BB3D0F
MDVRALLAHLIGVLDRIAALGDGANPLAVNDRAVDDDRWLDAWRVSAERATGAWIDGAALQPTHGLTVDRRSWGEGVGLLRQRVDRSYVGPGRSHGSAARMG